MIKFNNVFKIFSISALFAASCIQYAFAVQESMVVTCEEDSCLVYQWPSLQEIPNTEMSWEVSLMKSANVRKFKDTHSIYFAVDAFSPFVIADQGKRVQSTYEKAINSFVKYNQKNGMTYKRVEIPTELRTKDNDLVTLYENSPDKTAPEFDRILIGFVKIKKIQPSFKMVQDVKKMVKDAPSQMAMFTLVGTEKDTDQEFEDKKKEFYDAIKNFSVLNPPEQMQEKYMQWRKSKQEQCTDQKT